MLTDSEVDRQVRELLKRARIVLVENEVAMHKRNYRRLRDGVDSLCLPETRYEEPAPIFSARSSPFVNSHPSPLGEAEAGV